MVQVTVTVTEILGMVMQEAEDFLEVIEEAEGTVVDLPEAAEVGLMRDVRAEEERGTRRVSLSLLL
jgi:hypothetical protein